MYRTRGDASRFQLSSLSRDLDTGDHVVLASLREQLTGDIRQPLLILMGAVGLLLVLACTNAAGLALASTHFLLTLFPNDVANLNIPKLTEIPMDGGVFLFAIKS